MHVFGWTLFLVSRNIVHRPAQRAVLEGSLEGMLGRIGEDLNTNFIGVVVYSGTEGLQNVFDFGLDPIRFVYGCLPEEISTETDLCRE